MNRNPDSPTFTPGPCFYTLLCQPLIYTYTMMISVQKIFLSFWSKKYVFVPFRAFHPGASASTSSPGKILGVQPMRLNQSSWHGNNQNKKIKIISDEIL